MNVIPLREDLMFPLEATFDKFFQDFFNTKANLDTAKSNTSYPKINCYFHNSNFYLVFAVPGVTQEDLAVEYNSDQNSITVRGRTSDKYLLPDHGPYYSGLVVREIRQSKFARSLSLPQGIEGEPEEANLEDGLLTLRWTLRSDSINPVKQVAITSKKKEAK